MLDNPTPNDITYFAETNFRNQRRRFGVKRDDRRRHFYIVGKTGMGKTVMLSNMIIQDIIRGEGVAVVDPHGELAEEILAAIPASRINDVVYFNPADLEHPIAFNILESVDDEYKHLVSSGLMGVFTKIWANMWSARMEYILNNCILALLDSPGNTLLGINRLLVDKEYRRKIVAKIKDPVVKAFWVDEYANYNERFRTEAIAPIQNKVGQFLSSSIVRNIVGQPKSTIDIRELMDQQKILLLNLSKGRIGEDNSALLGAMMITKVQLAAMSRVDIPEKERKDFYLYVDEFQNFATESFADILSEARKYRLNLIMAHQYIAQLTSMSGTGGRITKVKDAVFGNVGTIVIFRIGAPDAEELLKEFEPYFVETDMINLTKYNIYLKLMIDGVASKPFSAITMPPIKINGQSNAEKIIRVSRERYANPRSVVEEKILRWSGVEETMKETAAIKQVSEDESIFKNNNNHRSTDSVEEKPKSSKAKIKAICDNCGQEAVIKFKPDTERNVFCPDCLKLFKSGLIDSAKLTKKNLPVSPPNNTPAITASSDEQPSSSLRQTKSVSVADNITQPEIVQPSSDKTGVYLSHNQPAISLTDAINTSPIKFSSARDSRQSIKPGQTVNLQKTVD